MANGINSIRKGKRKQGTKSMGFRTKAKPTWPNLKTNKWRKSVLTHMAILASSGEEERI